MGPATQHVRLSGVSSLRRRGRGIFAGRRPFAAAALSLLLLSAVSILPGCGGRSTVGATASSDSTPTPRGAAAPRVVFDMAHGEIFGAEDTSDLGQSEAVQRIRDAGFAVDVSTEPLSADRLSGAAGVILPGPMRPLVAEEHAALKEYIRQGGTVLMTVHVPFPVLSVPAAFGLQPSTYVLQTTRPLAGAVDSSILLADRVEPDAITKGVSSLLVVSGWAIQPISDEARIIAGTDTSAWMDADRDGKLSPTDPQGSFGVVGVSDSGAGSFILVGDDAVFANVAIEEADNARLLDNILKLMAQRTKAT